MAASGLVPTSTISHWCRVVPLSCRKVGNILSLLILLSLVLSAYRSFVVFQTGPLLPRASWGSLHSNENDFTGEPLPLRNEGPRTGSRQRYHSSAVGIAVIMYTTMTKLNEDFEKRHKQLAKLSSKINESKLSQSKGQSVQRKSKLLLCPLGTQRDFHVSALCVEDPSPPLTPSIDATNRRRHQPVHI